MADVATIEPAAQAYGEDDLDLEHRLLGWGPIDGRQWIAQLRDKPGGVIVATFTVTATDVDTVVDAATRHDVHVRLHLDGELLVTLPATTWFDVREIRDGAKPFTLFRRQLMYRKVITHVD